jgi:SAM-dependent methyltransferase
VTPPAGPGAAGAEFDNAYYLEVNRARERVLDEIVSPLVARLGLKTAVDVGAGVGYFTRYLSAQGLTVTAVDGRPDNVAVLRERVPAATAMVADAEELHHAALGVFDLVFCAGLLYHLENPFRAIRNLQRLCAKVCVIESRVHWAADPVALCIREGGGASQALHGFALLPSRRCLVNMLHGAGFAHVYSVPFASDHPELSRAALRPPRRHFFVAAAEPLDGVAGLELEPVAAGADLETATPYARSLRRFARALRDVLPWLFQARPGV